MLVGPPDSGKTSWFAPFEGIIPSDHIAGVLKDGNFAAHLVKSTTQVVFMDEWSSDSLSVDQAKTLLQGGLQFQAQKHRDGAKYKYNSGFYITTNVYPDFGLGPDSEVIKRRLSVFDTKVLPSKDNNATAWMRKHCMQVFHYLAHVLRNKRNFECGNGRSDVNDEEGAIYNDFDFDTAKLLEDAGNILSQSFTDVPVTTASAAPQEEFAILEADHSQGVLYEHTTFDHPLFDCEATRITEEYMQKVFDIICTVAWQHIRQQFSHETEGVYEMRHRNQWLGADSVYDAWLLRNGVSRRWFPTNAFHRAYPNWKLSVFGSINRDDDVNTDVVVIVKEEQPQIALFRTKHQVEEAILLPSDSEEDSVPVKEEPGLFRVRKSSTEIAVISDSE